MDGTGVRILVEGWDGAPFYQVLVAAVASEGEALLAAACHLTREGARLVSHDPEETTWVDLAALPDCCRVEPASPEGILFESGRLWGEAHFAPRRPCPLLDGVRAREGIPGPSRADETRAAQGATTEDTSLVSEGGATQRGDVDRPSRRREGISSRAPSPRAGGKDGDGAAG